jgi:hypothetical protein
MMLFKSVVIANVLANKKKSDNNNYKDLDIYNYKNQLNELQSQSQIDKLIIANNKKYDTFTHGRVIKKMITSYDDYKNALYRTIIHGYKKILYILVEDISFNERYKNDIMNDDISYYGETIREYFINLAIISNEKYMLQLICYLFEIQYLLPEYEQLIDLKYTENKKFINTRRDFEYIMENLDIFEELFGGTKTLYNELLYNAGKKTTGLFILRKKIEDYFERTLSEIEVKYLKNRAREYADYIEHN